MLTFERITQTPGVMGGRPCIRDMRVTVGMLVRQIADGARGALVTLDAVHQRVRILPIGRNDDPVGP